ncbi:MAG: hypothetical protein RL120_17025, partial [Gammaproteobacteria bacterium]
SRFQEVVETANLALQQLPAKEVMLRARVAAHLAQALWRRGNKVGSLDFFQQALVNDPSIFRRLETWLPVNIVSDGSDVADSIAQVLARSPRFRVDNSGLLLSLNAASELSACINDRNSQAIRCYTMPPAEAGSSADTIQQFNQEFHRHVFGLGYDISQAQRSILMGSSVILSSQNNPGLQQTRDRIMNR